MAVELARTPALKPAAGPYSEEADRLNALIRQMLEVTRTEADPSRMKADHVRLDELVAGLVDDCSIEAAAHGFRSASSIPFRWSLMAIANCCAAPLRM